MSFFGQLFATPKSIEKVVDTAISAGDKLVYTEQERAEMRLKISDWYLRYLEATQPMNLSRRFLTIIVSAIWALFLTAGTTFAITNKAETSDLLFRIMSEHINTPFSIIIGFYFAAHAVRALGGAR